MILFSSVVRKNASVNVWNSIKKIVLDTSISPENSNQPSVHVNLKLILKEPTLGPFCDFVSDNN